MPSNSWIRWNTERADALDQIENAHASVGGTGRGRRFATEQINHAYATLLSSQFQGFSRDLHTECIDHIIALSPVYLQTLHLSQFAWGRTLDRGNPTPGNLGSDFNRLGVDFWNEVTNDLPRNNQGHEMLERLNRWRNAIAHQDFDPAKLGGTITLHLVQIRNWRRALNRLAQSFDNVMRSHLYNLLGKYPGD
jgi:hypothetical protein